MPNKTYGSGRFQYEAFGAPFTEKTNTSANAIPAEAPTVPTRVKSTAASTASQPIPNTNPDSLEPKMGSSKVDRKAAFARYPVGP